MDYFPYIIAKALEKIEVLAKKKRKKLVLFMDEFQTLAEATNHHGVAKNIWKAPLSEMQFQLLFDLTQRHPYYVNKLYALLSFHNIVSDAAIKETWKNYVLENRSAVEGEISLLSVNQRKLLFTIARHTDTKELLSKEFSHLVSIAPGSIPRAASVLINKDYIYKNEEGYYNLVDPLVCAVLDLS